MSSLEDKHDATNLKNENKFFKVLPTFSLLNFYNTPYLYQYIKLLFRIT